MRKTLGDIRGVLTVYRHQETYNTPSRSPGIMRTTRQLPRSLETVALRPTRIVRLKSLVNILPRFDKPLAARIEEVANDVRANIVRETGRWRSPAQIPANVESTIKALECIRDPKVCRTRLNRWSFVGGRGHRLNLNEAESLRC